MAVTLRLRPELHIDDDEVALRGGAAPGIMGGPGPSGGGSAAGAAAFLSRPPVALDDVHGEAGKRRSRPQRSSKKLSKKERKTRDRLSKKKKSRRRQSKVKFSDGKDSDDEKASPKQKSK